MLENQGVTVERILEQKDLKPQEVLDEIRKHNLYASAIEYLIGHQDHELYNQIIKDYADLLLKANKPEEAYVLYSWIKDTNNAFEAAKKSNNWRAALNALPQLHLSKDEEVQEKIILAENLAKSNKLMEARMILEHDVGNHEKVIEMLLKNHQYSEALIYAKCKINEDYAKNKVLTLAEKAFFELKNYITTITGEYEKNLKNLQEVRKEKFTYLERKHESMMEKRKGPQDYININDIYTNEDICESDLETCKAVNDEKLRKCGYRFLNAFEGMAELSTTNTEVGVGDAKSDDTMKFVRRTYKLDDSCKNVDESTPSECNREKEVLTKFENLDITNKIKITIPEHFKELENKFQKEIKFDDDIKIVSGKEIPLVTCFERIDLQRQVASVHILDDKYKDMLPCSSTEKTNNDLKNPQHDVTNPSFEDLQLLHKLHDTISETFALQSKVADVMTTLLCYPGNDFKCKQLFKEIHSLQLKMIRDQTEIWPQHLNHLNVTDDLNVAAARLNIEQLNWKYRIAPSNMQITWTKGFLYES